MRRGLVPNLLLAALLDGPAHGYELMDRLEQFSGGTWRPSPGSVYPLLQVFEDRGIVHSHESDGRRVFSLTDAGRSEAEAQARHRGEAGRPSFPVDPRHAQMRAEVHQLRAASRQVVLTAGPERVDQALAIVRGARQALYRLLAEE